MMEIDIKNIVKETIEEQFDMGDFVDSIAEDITKNPEWWADNIVTPIKKEILRQLKNQPFMEAVMTSLLEKEWEWIKNTIEDSLQKYLQERVIINLPDIRILVDEKTGNKITGKNKKTS